MNAAQKKAASVKLQKQFKLVREQYWPEVTDNDLWNRKASDGYATLPRTMPQIIAIIDALCPKGKPASMTYMALWFRGFDLMMQLRITSPGYLANESGFGGERAITTWQGRMQQLSDIGFIKVAKGPAGPYEHVIIPNPYHVIYGLHKNGGLDIPYLKDLYREFVMRSGEIGAKDLELIAAVPPLVMLPPIAPPVTFELPKEA